MDRGRKNKPAQHRTGQERRGHILPGSHCISVHRYCTSELCFLSSNSVGAAVEHYCTLRISDEAAAKEEASEELLYWNTNELNRIKVKHFDRVRSRYKKKKAHVLNSLITRIQMRAEHQLVGVKFEKKKYSLCRLSPFEIAVLSYIWSFCWLGLMH